MRKELLRIWGFDFEFVDFNEASINNLQNLFYGSFEKIKNSQHSICHTIINTKELEMKTNITIKRKTRHKGGSKNIKYFLNGKQFKNESQNRYIDIIFDSEYFAIYRNGSNTMFCMKDKTLINGTECDWILYDILENILLSKAKQNNWVNCHSAAWVDNENKANLILGNSGIGKTTRLLKEIKEGSKFLSNDRVFLKLVKGKLFARSFPQPVNIGFGTIRSLNINFGIDVKIYKDFEKLRLTAKEAFSFFEPNYDKWFEVEKVYTNRVEALRSNLYIEEDECHPFWNTTQSNPFRNISKNLIKKAYEKTAYINAL